MKTSLPLCNHTKTKSVEVIGMDASFILLHYDYLFWFATIPLLKLLK